MIHTGDCVEVMAGMELASVDAIVTDPPYGIRFMGKAWDGAEIEANYQRALKERVRSERRPKGGNYPNQAFGVKAGEYNFSLKGNRAFQEWCTSWAAEAFRIAKPGAYLLAFGGTRTYHRMTCAIEDAGWIIRDCLVWAYASGFPKSKALLKPAWEPIVMARKPGPLRELAIDACRIPSEPWQAHDATGLASVKFFSEGDARVIHKEPHDAGRWPANLVLTDPIFDGDTPGVVGGGEDYSRFFALPKADRAEREPVLGGLPSRVVSVWGGDEDDLTPGKKSTIPRRNHHPTVKPLELMRHLVRLVTPAGGTVLDPFLGSGTTALAAEMEGFAWLGIEKEAEYVAIAEARLNGTQRGLGLTEAIS